MKKIKIFDTTLRDGEQSPGCSMNMSEKLKMAAQLDALGVDVIEAGFAIASPGDFAAVKGIAGVVKNAAVASLARALKKDIDTAWEAVKEAVRPRLHVFLATSDLHMQYKLKMSREEVLKSCREMVSYARSLCEDVEFSAEDASRSDLRFLCEVVQTAIEAGASTINLPDTVGYAVPTEYGKFIADVMANVKDIDKVTVSVHCHNDLGMATANSLMAVLNGATQIECTVNGIGERAGNTALEEVVMALKTRKDVFGADTDIDTTQIFKTSKLLTAITGVKVQPNKAVVGENAFAHESGIHQHGVLAKRETYEIMTPESIGLSENKMVLGKHSGKHAIEDKLRQMGFTVGKEELQEIFEEFKVLCDKKKDVNDADLEALVTHSATEETESPDGYKLDWFAVHTSNFTTATSTVCLKLGDEKFEDVCLGDGPVDAAFQAIDRIVKPVEHTFELYRINSISQGKDTLGEVSVKLTAENRTFSGRGLSTDIIEASILAYISAVNKLRAYTARKNKEE